MKIIVLCFNCFFVFTSRFCTNIKQQIWILLACVDAILVIWQLYIRNFQKEQWKASFE